MSIFDDATTVDDASPIYYSVGENGGSIGARHTSSRRSEGDPFNVPPSAALPPSSVAANGRGDVASTAEPDEAIEEAGWQRVDALEQDTDLQGALPGVDDLVVENEGAMENSADVKSTQMMRLSERESAAEHPPILTLHLLLTFSSCFLPQWPENHRIKV